MKVGKRRYCREWVTQIENIATGSSRGVWVVMGARETASLEPHNQRAVNGRSR